MCSQKAILMSDAKYVTTVPGQGSGFSVGRKATAGTGEKVPLFTPRLMPDGRVIQELDRRVHEKGLEAVRRMLKGLAADV